MKTGRMAMLAGLLAVGIATTAQGQEMYLQGSNEMRWADGLETIGGEEVAKRYFEDRLYLNLYSGNLRFGTRFTLLQPSEFGEHQTGVETLDQRFIEYNDPDVNLRVRAGDFFAVWGRGLGLALVEDITQGFDSGLDGVQARFGAGSVEFEGLSGRSEAGYLGLVREAQVSGAHLLYNAPLDINLGAQGILVTPVEGVGSYSENRTWAGHAAWDGSSTALWFEYAREFIDGVDDDHGAFYSSASWFGSNLGLVIDYKRYNYYRYGGGIPGSGSSYAQSVDILPFHAAPIVQREFTSPLFSKHPHIVRFDDEVGIQLEATYSFAQSSNLVLNLSQSSSYVEDDAWLPTLKEEDSPYRQAFLEYSAYPTSEIYLQGWTGWDEELVYYNEGTVRSRITWLNRAVLGGGGTWQFSRDWSTKLSVEGAQVRDLNFDESWIETLTSIGATFQQKYSVTASLETAGQDPDQPDKTTWFKLEAGAFIANRHELLVTVGEERGGLVCTSGKCRLVTPFEGVKVSLTSVF